MKYSSYSKNQCERYIRTIKIFNDQSLINGMGLLHYSKYIKCDSIKILALDFDGSKLNQLSNKEY